MIRYNLSSPVSSLSHIGRTVEAQLRHLGILTIQDLLFYFPVRYDDLRNLTYVKDLKIGERAVVRGKIELIQSRRSKYRRKLLTEAIVSDATGSFKVLWFGQPWIIKIFKAGDELYLVGEVKDDGAGTYMSSPSYERAGGRATIHTGRLVPVYASTEKLSQKQIRFLVNRAFPLIAQVSDYLPKDIKTKHKLLDLNQALSFVHFPPDDQKMETARRRLKFDELLRLQLFAAKVKQELKKLPAPKISFNEEATRQFVNSLPFKLTEAQRKAAWEILQDLSRARPMNRLLEGDVGSGKTVVVAIAALNAVLGVYDPALPPLKVRGGEEGLRGQVAIMAPTEILARQHFNTFSKLLGPQGLSMELRTSGEKRKKGFVESDIIVGTHALIQDSVKFKNLVLAVVDEQHRFGVRQRQALKDKRRDTQMPHLLTLTATPIPRSLALVFYGDLDLSVLNEMPKGRQMIETRIVGAGERKQAQAFVREEVKAGHQIFWTCPIIDPSDTLGVSAATEVFKHLRVEIFPDLRIGLLHGRMKSKEREQVMSEFAGISRHPERSEGSRDSSASPQNDRSHTIDILVATPVIEVGIDVPNATVMVIEGAQRFGLAQLHQFRGRVGRGEVKSYCLLFIDEDKVNARLKAFLESNNGFDLAEKDLKLRGPGDTYGVAQSGFPEFKIASFADIEIAKEAKEAAELILTRDPELAHYPELKKAILDKEGQAHLE